MRVASLVCALLLPLSAVAAAAPVTWSNVVGEWQVVAVTPKKEMGQIYIKNDPQFMGARVAFKPNAINWTRGTAERSINPSVDNCATKPRLTAANGAGQDRDFTFRYGFNVSCGNKSWGPAPGAVLSVLADGNARLFWDGAELALHRIK
ncbi:hypothetical protein HS962_08000 [Pantoea sp. BIGb0393]|uniref:DUF2147 domain-containing protein n=1 Tax=Pantoea nemavictus TaxID=2726955 RepID=A0ABU8PQX7_9GAMM|nr:MULTISPECIES: hypothetical protein [Pantoea]EJL82970.1 hypothetical protein PMI17_04272 [Pantoea sp. GM01]MBA0036165.1 hypothetical protein [Pantoea nemavictus]